MERPRRDPQRISDVLTDLMATRGYAQLSANQECNEAWKSVVGNIHKLSRATEVKRGVLHVVVSNSVVMQELTFRKQELIPALDAALPSHQVKDVRFRVGTIS